MPLLILKVEIAPTYDVADVYEELIALAKKLDVMLSVLMSGSELIVHPEQTVYDLERSVHLMVNYPQS